MEKIAGAFSRHSKSLLKGTLVLAWLVSLGCTEKQTETPVDPAQKTQSAPTAETNKSPDLSVDKDGLSKAVVMIKTNKGMVEYQFYPKEAPKTVKRIIELVNSGFYNGLKFHRVVPGFVVQGGDPKGDGTGGSGTNLPAEFNTKQHVPGTVAMARARDPNSADSQFYISLGTHPHLDRNYTVFGKVKSGMDVVKKITVGDVMETVTIK